VPSSLRSLASFHPALIASRTPAPHLTTEFVCPTPNAGLDGQRLALRRNKRHTCCSPRLGWGTVEIGEPERTYTVEPLENPVPRERPAEPAEQPVGPSPAEEPIEPERVPAP
jgi:hypothetical protein